MEFAPWLLLFISDITLTSSSLIHERISVSWLVLSLYQIYYSIALFLGKMSYFKFPLSLSSGHSRRGASRTWRTRLGYVLEATEHVSLKVERVLQNLSLGLGRFFIEQREERGEPLRQLHLSALHPGTWIFLSLELYDIINTFLEFGWRLHHRL